MNRGRPALPPLRGLVAQAHRDPEAAEALLIDCVAASAVTEQPVYITRVPAAEVRAAFAAARDRARQGASSPLLGVPFVVKDNIDVAGLPTTAGCPSFATTPTASAPVVERLIGAGAVLLGKTNLDQFATGLVGTRSPYGACASVFDPAYIAGGSSSGSAVAVASALAAFALGTDTAGSGRVPAAFNHLVGYKPTRGRLSTRGVVPACRSLDCVSVFAPRAEDCARIAAVAAGYDPLDPMSRELAAVPLPPTGALRFGVPRPDRLEFFGDEAARALFARAVAVAAALGATVTSIDFSPFAAAAELLYGPWIAERWAAVGAHVATEPGDLDPTVAAILRAGAEVTGADVFRAQHRLAELRRATEGEWSRMDVLMVPTTPTIYSLAAVRAAPLELNTRLGRYTNFVNLLDLAAVAIPSGFRPDGLPLGITLVGPAGTDEALLRLAGELATAIEDAVPAA